MVKRMRSASMAIIILIVMQMVLLIMMFMMVLPDNDNVDHVAFVLIVVRISMMMKRGEEDSE